MGVLDVFKKTKYDALIKEQKERIKKLNKRIDEINTIVDNLNNKFYDNVDDINNRNRELFDEIRSGIITDDVNEIKPQYHTYTVKHKTVKHKTGGIAWGTRPFHLRIVRTIIEKEKIGDLSGAVYELRQDISKARADLDEAERKKNYYESKRQEELNTSANN